MKVISDISLKDFGFWSGGRDTADDLTDEQLERIERELEDSYPDGMTDTELNDMFWFDRESIYKMAGVYPKFFKLVQGCGEVKFVRAYDVEDVGKIDSCPAEHEEIDETEAGTANIEDVGDFDLEDFANSKYFKVTSYIHRVVKIIRCTNDEDVNDMKEALKKCEIEEIPEVSERDVSDAEDWFYYDEGMINEFVYDEESAFDICNIPTYALCPIENDDFSGLDDEEEHEIREFMRRLNEGCPNGYTIDWEDLDNPFFTNYPEWGLPGDCFVGRIYPIKSIGNE